jgi:hypothetical protein
MHIKSFVFAASLAVVTAASSFASPMMTFVDNGDTTGTFFVVPSGTPPFTIPSVADPDSFAFEMQVNILSGGPGTATIGAQFPMANPGGASYPGITWSGGFWNGLSGSNTLLIRASFGSNLLTSGAPIPAVTIDLPGNGTLSYFGVVAQDGRNAIIGSTASPLTGVITPEPASAVMGCLAAAGLAFTRRR